MMFGVTEKIRRFVMKGRTDGARERQSSPALQRRGSRSGGKFAAEALEGRLLFASTPTPPNIAGNWALAFNDNFTSINPAVWSNTYWWGGTQGTQATFAPSQLSVNSSGLNITATQVASKSSTGVINPYTSGAIQTDGLPYQGKAPGFTFTYGYVETTMKAAPGLGMWSAIWMLPADHNDNYELDLAEILGRQPYYYTATYHTGSTFWQPNGTVSSDLTAGFHTYGVDWEPDHITWYIDGKALGSYTNASQIINRPMYLILNLDVGGSWAGPLGSSSPYSSTWQTQDVRVWQHTTATPPAAPTNLHSTSTTSTSVALAWTASTSSGISGYNVFRNGTQIGSVAGTVTSLLDSGDSPSTSYTYTVDAFNSSGGVSSLSSPLVVTTLAGTAAPAAPTSLHSTSTTSTSVALSWTASTSSGVTGYNVFRNGTKIGSAAGTSLTDSGLTAGTSYTYTVDAYNSSGGVSAMSASLVVTTPGGTSTLAAPTNLFSSSTTNTSVAVSWIASTSTGITGYNVFRNGTKIGSVAGNYTYLVDSGLTAGTTYTYPVDAFNAAGTVSAMSAPFVVTTLGGVAGPAAPTGLFSSSTTTTSVAVSWIASTSTGVTGYNIFRNGIKIGSVAGNYTFLVDYSLTPGTTYTYTVNAFNSSGGVSAMSAPFVVTTL
jgi:beta-glucanase (GH16 family)